MYYVVPELTLYRVDIISILLIPSDRRVDARNKVWMRTYTFKNMEKFLENSGSLLDTKKCFDQIPLRTIGRLARIQTLL